jgi:Mce-associated membrane protein
VAGLAVRPARILIAALSGVLAVLVGGGVWIAAQARDEQGRAGDKQAALQAAGTHAKNLVSLDYKSVDTDMRRILDTSTGTARAEYEANAGKLRSTTVGNKVVQHGVLRATGLVSITGTTARVLVVADVEIRWDGSDSPPQERFYRWQMDLSKVGGVWLASKVVQVR